jgi:hypothetical protein
MKTEAMKKEVRHLTRHAWYVCRNALRSVGAVCLAATLVITTLPAQAQRMDVGGKKNITFYQANAYIGGSIEQVLGVDPADTIGLLTTVTEIYGQILASQPPARMSALADEIDAARPEIAALEEVWTIEQAPLTAQGPGAFAVVHDYLQLLTDALAAKGAHYRVAVVATESDLAMPMFDLVNGGLAVGRVIDHEVILVRTDLPPGYLRVENPQTGHFNTLLRFPSVGITVVRGWCSVDVFTRGERFHFVCTHLEDEMAGPIQEAQGLELLAGPANVNGPVVVLGDLNADPFHRTGTATYDSFVADGFEDAWAVLNPATPAAGLTWGHDPLLADPGTAFNRRIDFVLYRGAQFTPIKSTVFDPQISLTAPPLWPSDHAAVSASFTLGN